MANREGRRLVVEAARALGALGIVAACVSGVATGVSNVAGEPASVPPGLGEACGSDNPYLVTVCYYVPDPWISLPLRREDLPALVAFRDSPTDLPHYRLASQAEVGSVWGLAFSDTENALFAAAFHKRSIPFGPGGPGAIYRIDLASGAVSLFATVPNVGRNRHSPSGRFPDVVARDWAGKTSLGDLDVDSAAGELFVANLDDRRIYRFDLATARLLGSFGHGASAETWAEDARPFGLKFHEGRLYHGVVRSAEASRQLADLGAYVYASRSDGSDMRLVATAGLGGRRGRVRFGIVGNQRVSADLRWRPWANGDRTVADSDTFQVPMVYPMPVLADIELDAAGNMILGLHDRKADTTNNLPNAQGNVGNLVVTERSGMGFGDILFGRALGGTWEFSADREHYDDADFVQLAEESAHGGLAAVLRPDQVVAGAGGFGERYNGPFSLRELYYGALWYDNPSGNHVRHEGICRVDTALPRWGSARIQGGRQRPLSLDDDAILPPGNTVGDIELLCGPSPTPTTTATASSTSTATATPTSTRTASVTRSPTRTATLTSTSTATPTATPSATRTPTASATPTKPPPLYLPILPHDPPCDRVKPRVDVALVLDASTSMLQPTRAGRTKLDAAREAAGLFLDLLDLPGDQAAVVGFNATAWVAQPLTGDRQALRAALGGLQVVQLTRIDLGIRAGHDELRGPRRAPDHAPALIVLTDGRNNPEPVSSAIAAAAAAKAGGIRVFTVGLGDDVEVDALRQMASGPGDFHLAPDGEDLAAIYRAIAGAFEPCPRAVNWPYRP